jgi:hypothetical protein
VNYHRRPLREMTDAGDTIASSAVVAGPATQCAMWVPRVDAETRLPEPFAGARPSSYPHVMAVDGALIHLVTPCTCEEEFIEQFARFTTATEIIVPAVPDMCVGTVAQLAICLTNQTEVMRGRCEVTEIRPRVGATPALMHLRMREMDAHTCGIHLRLMERQAAPPPAVPEPTRAPLAPLVAQPAAPFALTFESSAVTVVRAAPALSEDPTARHPEGQAPDLAGPLPANPLGEVETVEMATCVEPASVEPTLAEPTLVETKPLGEGERSVGRLPAPRESARARDPRARRGGRRAAFLASCATVAMVAIVVEPGLKAVPMVITLRAADAPAAAPAPVTPPAPEPPPVKEAEVESPKLPARDCAAYVRTRPEGAEVLWGDVVIGTSPLANAAIPCGTATVTLRRERYVEARRVIVTAAGQPAVVAQRLKRMSAHDRAKIRRSRRAARG